MPRTLAPLLSSLALLLLPRASHADVWVDSKHGSDITGAGTSSQPYKSITHALTLVTAPETIFLAPGSYREGTGESFPLVLTPGISLVSLGNSQNTTIQAPPFGQGIFPKLIEVCGEGPLGATTRIQGLLLNRGEPGIDILDTAPAQAWRVEVEDVLLDNPSSTGVRVVLDQAGQLELELHQLRTALTVTGVRARVNRGLLDLDLRRCRVDALITAVDLLSIGSAQTSHIEAEISTSRIRGTAQVGLRCEVNEGNTISTLVRDTAFQFNAPCPSPTPVDNSAAIVDHGPAAGQIQHHIERTIFFANGAQCSAPGVNYDLYSYRPDDYVLADNLYGWPGLPGGVQTTDPGYLSFDNDLGWDDHLRSTALALNASPSPSSPYVWGDLDGDFPVQDPQSGSYDPELDEGAACFDGLPDIGPDERRSHAVYAFPELRVGKSALLRALGPASALESPSNATPIQVGFFVGEPPLDPSQCPTGLELPPGAYLLGSAQLDPLSGLGELSVTVPDLLPLAGRELGVQAVFYNPSSGQCTWARALSVRIKRK